MAARSADAAVGFRAARAVTRAALPYEAVAVIASGAVAFIRGAREAQAFGGASSRARRFSATPKALRAPQADGYAKKRRAFKLEAAQADPGLALRVLYEKRLGANRR